jgi:flagellin
MSRINTNVDSLVALNQLNKTNRSLGTTLTRLSTGVRVNNGADDPAGLISGDFLRQEISSVRSAIQNSNRANNVISTADAALGEIGGLLERVRGILTTSENRGTISQSELEANQSAIDSAVSAIDRIAGSTQFSGRKLLDGSLGFQVSGLGRFDSGTGTFTNVRVNLANFNASGSQVAVQVTLTTAATRAAVTLSAASATSDTTLEITGSRGSTVVRVGNGQAFAAAINAVSDVTGATATGTTVNSIDFGKNAIAKIKNIVGNAVAGAEASGFGTDAVGTINGQAFSADGLRASVKTAALDVEVTFSSGTASATTTTFNITSGGARFQIGSEINSQTVANLGISSFFSTSLGVSSVGNDRTLASIVTGGSNSLTSAGLVNAASRARIGSDIVKDVINQVANTRSRLGAFVAYTLESNTSALGVRLENLSAARSQIVDTDFAEETANLTRLQILQQAGTSSLAISNSRPQSVLALLGS